MKLFIVTSYYTHCNMRNVNPTKIEGLFTHKSKARKMAVQLVQDELNYLEEDEKPTYAEILNKFKKDSEYVAGGTIFYIEEHCV